MEAGAITAGDPDDSAFPAVEDAFQPLVSPNGAFAIYWTGRMAQVGDEWQFVEGGAPWLANHVADGEGGFELTDGRSVFSGLVVDRDAFSSAAITWSIDSDAYGTIFWLLTGFHWLHVVAGLILMLALARLSWPGSRAPIAVHHQVVAYYWHFVDVVWVGVFVTVYLIQ